MRLNQVGLLVGFVVFWLSIQFLGALAGPLATLLLAILIGVLGTFTANFFSLLERPLWLLPVVLGCCSLVGLGISSINHQPVAYEWLAAPLCLLASGGVVLLQTMSRKRCGLCNRRLNPNALTFTCPRCALVVCDEKCWDFEHRRCQLCVEHHVPILSAQKQWWDRTLGPATVHGRCQVCMASFDQADLRLCGRCRRPQCRDCWDNLNGECSRCGWVIADLPESLKLIHTSYSETLPSQQYE
ncbi:hypothetical protein [Edaphobacter dinghuensis]|uniref:hypothetical protein n=1 Tax=Edaphobacter dinghuensis TaxID=1560005 RepID=UPI00166DBC62|nr:hypothetical protein [Edaphobacter dinghuensis]